MAHRIYASATSAPIGVRAGLMLLLYLVGLVVLGDCHAQQIDVVGARFDVRDATGRVLSQDDLVGSVISMSDAAGNNLEIRIDSAEPDPTDDDGDVYLYSLKIRDSQSGQWRDVCQPDADGRSRGFPLPNPDPGNGGPYMLTCTGGAIGKCVRLGYKPWKTDANGNSLRNHHQACVHMIRADYCGSGAANTRDGTLVNIFDKLDIQVPDPEPADFEAAWGPTGAVCVRKTRVPDLITLDELVEACPDKLSGHTGDACTEEGALRDSRALILNRS